MFDLPPVVRIEPASSCNLRCLHCPTGLGESPKGLMTEDTFDKVLIDLYRYASQVRTVVLYHGGEPLLNVDLGKMIASVKSCGVPRVKLVSNGKLLNQFRAMMLIESGLDEIEFSIDSIGADESEGIRRRSDAAQTIANVNLLRNLVVAKKSHLKISISTTQFVDDYEIDSLENLFPSPIPKWLSDLFPGLEIKSTWAVQWPGGFPGDRKIAFRDLRVNKPKTCSLLNETITVRSNGDVVVCCYDLTGLSNLGNVNVDSLSTIWKSEGYKIFRDNFEKGVYPEPCKSCAIVTGNNFLSRAKILSNLN
jgi:radical SAM protein with 4Fe4S-binding SPASM domain